MKPPEITNSSTGIFPADGKSLKAIALLLVLTVCTSNLHAQGTFQNLGFEQATITPISGSPVDPFGYSASAAMPGWNLYIGDSQINWILYNNLALAGSAISIHDSASSLSPLQGNYSAFLQGSFGNLSPSSVSITQNGLVPVGSQSLLFRAWGDNFQVSVNGQSLSLVPVSNIGNYTVFGADITSFAGSSSELKFTALPTGNLFFDSIQFSTQPVPEPSIYSLLGCGLLLFGAARATFKSRQ